MLSSLFWKSKGTSVEKEVSPNPLFGHQLREKYFAFADPYTPLNHGSYGAYPIPVRDFYRRLQEETESRSDPIIRRKFPKLLQESREAVAPLLGVDVDELVFVPNATTGVNTVLRALHFEEGDVILHTSIAYPACIKSIDYICEITPAERVCAEVTYPLEDDDLLRCFRETINAIIGSGRRPKLAMFDTVATFPGARLPWEALVKICRESNIFSLVDGAHGVGHIDLAHLGTVSPDFFTSNCYKYVCLILAGVANSVRWLYTPRGSAVFHVPFRNQHLIRSSVPTSHGYEPRPAPEVKGETVVGDNTFVKLFSWVATVDTSSYPCVLNFRKEICGGESQIRQYCFGLAQRGGQQMAEVLGTEVMNNGTGTLAECCFTNVRLPLHFGDQQQCESRRKRTFSPADGPRLGKWFMESLMTDHDTWIPCVFYASALWVRLSAQIYLDESDFRWAAQTLKSLCEHAEASQPQWPQ